MIPPPFPDPRKWKEIRQLQELHQTTRWMTSKLHDGLPTTPSKTDQPNPDGVHFAEYSEDFHTYTQSQPGSQSAEELHQISSSSRQLSQRDSHSDQCNGADNFIDGYIQHNDADQHGDGEEVEILQLDDFWIERLSQTVKRMKKKYNKKQ